MKIYLAARFGARFELRKYRTELQGIGYEVTSRWLDIDEGIEIIADAAMNRQWAKTI